MQNISHFGHEFLTGLFTRMGLEVEVQIAPPRRDTLVYELGGDLSLLKQRPDVMSALTLLCTGALARRAGERISCALVLEGHHLFRDELLETIAQDVAEVVSRTGRRGILEGLNPAERRQIHGILAEEEEVKTHSEGQGEARYLIVERA